MRHRFGRVAARAALCTAVALPAVLVRVAPVGGASDGTRGKVAAFGTTRPGIPLETQSLDLARVRKVGANNVSIDVWWDVDSRTATTMHPGAITATDQQLAAAIDAARAARLKVIFTPKLWCPVCQALNGFTWRGRLKPSDRAKFFASYRAMVNKYAALARDHKVDMFFIGSEMSELQDAADEWRAVAREVRARFPGKLAYQVNWDVYDRVTFWDAVDVAGLSAYFPLSDEARPSVGELKAAWHDSRAAKFLHHDWFANTERLHRESRKPVLFGELGYPSAQYAASAPYDATKPRLADLEIQKNAYQAALEVFEPQSWWMGVVWWEWFVSGGGPNDTSYSPRDKPAEKFLTTWYNR
jgi:glycosyl hydrolase family 113